VIPFAIRRLKADYRFGEQRPPSGAPSQSDERDRTAQVTVTIGDTSGRTRRAITGAERLSSGRVARIEVYPADPRLA
jgi:hypothetical protein